MELGIQKYCSVDPRKIRIDGKNVIEAEMQGSLELSLIQTYRSIGMNYLKFFKMDNLSKLAVISAEIILRGTEFYNTLDKKETAVVLANASSSLVSDANYQKTISDPRNYFPSPSLFVYTLPNICIGEICIKHKIYGENVFLISQKFDPDLLYFNVNELFKKSGTQNCLTGWVECNDSAYEAFMLLVRKEKCVNVFDTNTINRLYNQII